MDFTKIPENVQNYIQENAGILCTSFNPTTREISGILGATTGGINFNEGIAFVDWGEDIDNCPKNTMELKRVDSRDIKITGTFVSATKELVKSLMGAADIDSNNSKHIIPRNELKTTDFKKIYFVCDYGVGGYVALELNNTLSTTGFQIQTGDKAKGQMSFEFTAHPSADNPDIVPYSVYIDGSASEVPMIELNRHNVTIAKDDTFTLTARTVPDNATVTWSSSDNTKASVSNGVVTGEAVGTAIITASITQSSVTYNDTCTIIVEA